MGLKRENREKGAGEVIGIPKTSKKLGKSGR